MKYAIQENYCNVAIKILSKIYRERQRQKRKTWYFMKCVFKTQQGKETDETDIIF